MKRPEEPGAPAAGLDRRRLLLLAGAAALLPAAARKAASPSATIPASRRRMLQVNGYASDAETPLDALTTYITPNDMFFVRHHWNPAYQDATRWALTVDGDVDRPQRLTLADLKKMLPRVPMVKAFDGFVDAGRKLADLHLNYEAVKPYPLEEIFTELVQHEDMEAVAKDIVGAITAR